jgi:hypothetical protein
MHHDPIPLPFTYHCMHHFIPIRCPLNLCTGRGDLLAGIQGFKKGNLNHTETVDKSGPDIAGPKKGGVGGGVKGAMPLPG